MRVLVAGATGVIGRQLVPVLQGAGHHVVGLSRPDSRRSDDAGSGTADETVAADALDAQALAVAVEDAKPDAVVHLLTAIPARVNPKRLAADFALTNRLRTEGTRNLLDAVGRSGATRVVTEGLAYAYRPTGGPLANEDAPLWSGGPKQLRPVVDALIEHERLTREAGGVVLRFGHLYGPGSAYASDGTFTEQVRHGKVPIVGGGTAVFSFTHARDAATAIAAALDKPVSGVLNIVDDHPVPLHEWLPQMARLLGSPEPRSAPALLARLAVGSWGVAFMTKLPGADNTRARLRLDWRPGYPSWREGFAAELPGRGSHRR